VLEMEACWPSGVVLRGMASNHRMLRWLKTVVVSDPEKARLTRQVGTGKTFQKRPSGLGWACAVEASISRSVGIEIEGPEFSFGMSLAGARVLARWCPA
jgi:hypothetical protein